MKCSRIISRTFIVGICVCIEIGIVDQSRAQIPDHANVTKPARFLEIKRAADGLFYITVSINRHPVRFLIDTGANLVMLTRGDAEAAGLAVHEWSFGGRVRTVGGASALAWIKLNDIEIEGRSVPQIDAAIVHDGLPVSLLGQNLLSKLGRLTIEGDRLRIYDPMPMPSEPRASGLK